MCIDCARRFISRLDLEPSTYPPPTGRWPICVIDHADHVHVRIDNVSGATEWVQVSAQREALLLALDEVAISYVIHVHENSSAGCSEAVIGALHQETVSANEAECSTTGAETCAVCCDCFNLGDEVVSLPCSHRYHAACIKTWLRRATSCPTCRAMVTRNSVGLPEESYTPVVETPILRHAAISTPTTRESRTTLPARRSAIRRLGSWMATHAPPRHATQENLAN
jgi:hypothetical protein